MSSSTGQTGKQINERQRMWSRAVLAKYWALQLPPTVLVAMVLIVVADRLAWPSWMVWTTVGLWAVKDAILYPFLWRAYDYGDPATFPYPLEGAEGVAIERIDPTGRVRIGGEIWRAEVSGGSRRIEAGETVHVKARHGLTLLIEPRN